MTSRITKSEFSKIRGRHGQTVLVETKKARPAFGLDKPVKSGRYVVSAPERRTSGGILFDSRAEMTRYHALKIMERIGEIDPGSIELHPVFPLEVNGVKIGRYTADFCYRTAEGVTVYEEVKSQATALEKDWRIRRKLAEAIYSIKIDEVRV